MSNWYSYLEAGTAWLYERRKLIIPAIAALVLLREFRAVFLILLALALVYLLVPDVRPYWSASARYFVYGIQQLF